MKRINYLILAILFGIFISTCKKQTDQFDSYIIEKEVRNTLQEYHEAMEKEGLLSEFRYLDSTENFYWVPPGYESALNFDSVRSILVKNAPTISSMNNEWSYLHIFPLNDTLANYTGKLHMISRDTAGGNFEADLLETGMMVKRWDGWKLLSGQSRIVD